MPKLARLKLLVVVNLQAGSSSTIDIEKSLRALPGTEYELIRSRSLHEFHEKLHDKIQKGNLSRILIAGGDGSIMQALPTLIQHPDIPVALLPLGTGNLLARNLNIPLEIEKALKVAIHGVESEVRLGQINEHIFILNAGIGIDAEIISKTKQEAKQRWGPWAYLWEGLKLIPSLRPTKIKLELDGKTKRTKAIGIMCTGSHSELMAGINIAPHLNIDDLEQDDTWLYGSIYKMTNLLDSIYAFIQVITRHSGTKEDPVEVFKAKEIRIQSSRKLIAQADGNVIGETPVTIKLLPHKLKIMVPKNR